MNITFAGTGTSTGIPMIGCTCPTCLSNDPHDKRLRCCIIITHNDGHCAVIDAGPDFRHQMLTHSITRLDALLLTHAHADHIAGLDDIRQFNFLQHKPIPIHANTQTITEIKTRFPYIWNPPQQGGGIPQIEPHPHTNTPFTAAGFTIQPLAATHGKLPVCGYRIGPFAYLTDISTIPNESLALMHELEILVLGAPVYHPHSTHISIAQAVDISQTLAPKQTFLTHLSHEVIHAELTAHLPKGIEPAYDGLVCQL